MSLKVAVGDQIPSVGLRASDGYLLNLRSWVTKQPAVILFFGAATLEGVARRRGTRAALALADEYERLREAGIVVAGVSCDSAEQQAEYLRETKLPYLLMSDERRTAVEMLGILTVADGENVNIAQPVAIAVDRDGEIRAIITELNPSTVVELLMSALAEPMPLAETLPGP
ncbi:MAG: peroxiredoxin family protein [Chloroflexota bacterium]|nr:peroxiredoxin family protein [Chloroflexota bacterium]